ncbi:exodeoxyribonuclease VII small subunit [Oceanibium sediminis]|uniref:exodeoxyribonuclease VII small subunit n=1 Tax=Oceanibium sediminis TaxID=2026339 RepID=UPI000DD47F1A|nr:exodeoxyribonuclease VII small subunit [Oceanibium sediminis]
MNDQPIAKMTFEQALAELEQVVGQLESGNTPLEESITLYERGAALKAHCETKLTAAEEKVSRITKSDDGTVTGETPFDAD